MSSGRTAVETAFLDFVRTAVLVDDEFPTYELLARGASQVDSGEYKESMSSADEAEPTGPAARDASRAASLWKAFRNCGWKCDIDDGTALDSANHRLGEADLVVVDYELRHEDPTPALQLLKELANADHASLAVVYTNNRELRRVRFDVAATLRGHLPIREDADAKAVDDRLDSLDIAVDADVALTYLRGQQVMRTAFGEAVVRGCRGVRMAMPDVVSREVEKFLRDEVGAQQNDIGLPVPFEIDASGNGDEPLWVLCNNLFVAFVQKESISDADEHEGARVISELRRALADWNPDGLTLTLAYARGSIARSGFKAAADALDNRLKNAGFLYFANSGEQDDREERVRQLYRRVLSGYAENLLTRIAEFGASAIRAPSENEIGDPTSLAKWALEEARCNEEVVQLFHELNRFLSTEQPRAFARLGTVFRCTVGDSTEFWMCASPSCDMVPRSPKKDRWEGKLDPIRPVILIKGERVTKLDVCLKEAEQGRAIFVTLNENGRDERRVIRFVPSKSTPILEHFYLQGRGAIDNQKVQAFRSYNKENRLALHEVTLDVVAQVRELYANRFLRSVGEHLSRIGVDFVRYGSEEDDAVE